MAGDHLTARQTQSGYTVLGQHTLSTSTGLYSQSSATWATQYFFSQIDLPRCGQHGAYLININNAKTLRCVAVSSAFTAGTDGITLECVAVTKLTNYNFFGGAWQRDIVGIWGAYAYNVRIRLAPVNDNIADTQGRAIAITSDVGATRIASKTVHSRPVISDGVPHHLALTHEATGTSNVMKLYVDGVNTETYTLTAALANFDANTLIAGVDDYFTGFDGSISHICCTRALLSAAEIEARAQLVNGVSGPVIISDSGILAWSAADRAWMPVRHGSADPNEDDISEWYRVRPPS